MALILNPTTGEILFTEDPTAYYQQGYRDPTADELEHSARTEEFGGFTQQAQAQAERVVRGATLGAVDGFGTPEDIRARAEVSEELSPITSAVAGIVPDVAVAAATGGLGGLATGAGRAAGRAALAEGAGLLRAGLSAARAGGATALGAESLGTGLVTAGQDAYAEGRQLGDDPGADAENILIWGGLNFGLGKLLGHSIPKDAESIGSLADDAGASLDDIAKTAEHRAAGKAEADIAAAADSSVPLQGLEIDTPARAPLDDIELPGPDGMFERVAPDDPRLAQLGPELDELRSVGIGDASLKDMGALDLEDGAFPDAARGSREKVDWMKQDPTFLEEGNLPAAMDRERGGLPSLNIYDGKPYLNNGRHRVTAARESGLDEVVMNVAKFDAQGNQLWDYVGPVRVAKKAEDTIPAAAVREGKREAVDGGVERALRNASKADADDIVDQALGATPAKEADSFGRQRRLYINREAIYDVAEREMAQDLGRLVKDARQVSSADKLASIASNVGENLGAQRAVAKGIAQDAAKFAGELKAEARAYARASEKKGMQYAIPGQKAWTGALMDHAKEIEKAKGGRALFEAVDSFKRAAQEFKLSLEAGALNSANPIHHQKLIPKIDSFAQKLRGSLEDSGVWGKAGEMQRAYNAVISDKLLPHMRTFEEAVMKRTFKGYDGVWNLEGWETKVRSLLKDKDPGNRRHVGAVLDAMDELAGVRRKFGDAKMADSLEAQTKKVRRTLGLADEVQDATERMGALGEMVGGVPYGGAIAGGLAGGLPGAAIGAVLPGAVRGLVMGDLITAFQRLSGASDAAAQRGVDDWIRSSRIRGGGVRDKLKKALPQLSGEAKQLRDVALRRGVSQGMALFMGDDESPGAAFERWRDALLDQEKFFTELGVEYGTLQEESPETYMALAARADVSRRFLVERMPPNVAVSVANPNGYPPSSSAIEDWALYVNAVRFPARVVQNLGGARMQEIETLRTTNPRMHELAQLRTIEGIARARERGEQLDDAFLARVAIMFPDAADDGVGSPVFSKDFGQYVRDWKLVEAEQKKGGRGGSSQPRQLPPSPMTATVSGGATFGVVG